jgi:DNA repair exonuclease SbcCD nuclease subunit
MKIAVISDAHLFQTFGDNYDSIEDFQRALEEVRTRIAPDMLFLAGDMFDYKKTETTYVRHYEGEGYMIRIRQIIEKFGKPVYAIRGNHDTEEVLTGLDQTVENFHYVKNDVKNFGNFSVCFMDSFYETGGYGDDTLQAMERFLKVAVSKVKQAKNTLILLCHETFAPYENAIPARLVEFLKKNFDLVLNGHMHLWNNKAYNSDNIICLPSLLPSRIVKGRYSTERYQRTSADTSFQRIELGSPFGYVVVDTERKTAKLQEFRPSKKIVEVALDVTNLSLEECRKRLRTVLLEIDTRPDKNDLIILPVLKGEIAFSPLYLENVREDFPQLHVESIRSETILKTALVGGLVSAPILSVEQLYEKMKAEIPKLLEQIKDRGVEIDDKSLSSILKILLDEELIFRSIQIPQTRTRLHMVLLPIVELLDKVVTLPRPPNFEDNLDNFLKMVR